MFGWMFNRKRKSKFLSECRYEFKYHHVCQGDACRFVSNPVFCIRDAFNQLLDSELGEKIYIDSILKLEVVR